MGCGENRSRFEPRGKAFPFIINKEVCLVINTPKAKRNYAEDRKTIRKACLKYKVSYITTIAGALAAVKGIESVKNGMGGEGGVRSLQEYHSLIK